MAGFKKVIRNFFGTTRAQTNGFVVLLLVMAVAIFSQPLTRWWVSTRPQDFSKDKAVLDSITRNWKVTEKNKPERVIPEVVYFEFNPNTATKEELISLGFPEKLTARIVNYRQKHGTFRIKSDLLKMYGMDSSLYAKLVPYITLPETIVNPELERKKFVIEKKPDKKIQKFNLNEADTAQLKKIYGIGPTLAQRIVKYRDKLGGFVTQQQLGEVFGLDTAVIKKIISASYLPDPPSIKKISLNTADENMLAAHPYFGRKIASAIVTYRFQHGNFKSVDDLSRIPVIDKNNLGKLSPYVTVDP